MSWLSIKKVMNMHDIMRRRRLGFPGRRRAWPCSLALNWLQDRCWNIATVLSSEREAGSLTAGPLDAFASTRASVDRPRQDSVHPLDSPVLCPSPNVVLPTRRQASRNMAFWGYGTDFPIPISQTANPTIAPSFVIDQGQIQRRAKPVMPHIDILWYGIDFRLPI